MCLLDLRSYVVLAKTFSLVSSLINYSHLLVCALNLVLFVHYALSTVDA